MLIIVTGGAGFLGSNLCDRLLEDQSNPFNKIVCIDNLWTGHTFNIMDLDNHSRFKFIQMDVIDLTEDKWDTIPDIKELGMIYHLACPASPPQYQSDPIKTLQTNFIGTLNMLKLAHHYKARILLTSTSEVYGQPLEHPQTESYRGNTSCTGIRACYDEGKRIAETLMFDHNRQYGTDIRVVRIFNTYGPRLGASDGRVVSNFIDQALNKNKITIYGDGTQTRSFCYVDDTIDALILMMNNKFNFKGPVNIGNPNEITINLLATYIYDIIGNIDCQVEYYPLPSDDPLQRKPDISLAKEILGWEPKTSLENGLSKTINWFKCPI